jgi:hypothetical protein
MTRLARQKASLAIIVSETLCIFASCKTISIVSNGDAVSADLCSDEYVQGNLGSSSSV